MIGAGKRRHRVTLQSKPVPPSGSDAYGQPSQTWTTYATVWARVRSLRGDEVFRSTSEQFAAEATHEITVVWQHGLTDSITPLHQALVDGKTLDILYANYGERHLDDVILICKERLNWTGA